MTLDPEQNADPDPDPGAQENADPDPDPGAPKMRMQCGSGSETLPDPLQYVLNEAGSDVTAVECPSHKICGQHVGSKN